MANYLKIDGSFNCNGFARTSTPAPKHLLKTNALYNVKSGKFSAMFNILAATRAPFKR